MTKKVILLAAIVTVALGAGLFAQKTETVSGTLIDLKCYKAGVDSASRTVIPEKVEVKNAGAWQEVKAQAM